MVIAKRAAGTVQETTTGARRRSVLRVARMVGRHVAMAQLFPGLKRRVWGILHFAPNAMLWNKPSLPCENLPPRLTAKP